MPYYVYMLASRSRVLYTGFTNNITRRVWEHRKGTVPGFTKVYRVNRLVWYEPHDRPRSAIAREKQIKRWGRGKKIWLVEQENPNWLDLAANWCSG